MTKAFAWLVLFISFLILIVMSLNYFVGLFEVTIEFYFILMCWLIFVGVVRLYSIDDNIVDIHDNQVTEMQLLKNNTDMMRVINNKK